MLPDNICFTNSPAEELRKLLNKKDYSSVIALVDENTYKHCLPLFSSDLFTDVVQIESGEEKKTLATCEFIWGKMTDLFLDRHAVLVVIGGGVLGDMGGFCAATYKRGIDFVLVPTTLLAQVDASIGGKLGVDFRTFKNHIGVFQLPALTMISDRFLKTLSSEELRSGFAEVIKHCLISDRQMWDMIRSKALSDQDWETLAHHSVAFKARITTEDPREAGLRKILNAGHTVGHAVESYLLGTGNRILHGEAIAVGLIAEGYIAKERGLINNDELTEIVNFILMIFGKVSLSEHQIEAATSLAGQDKKNRANRILCVLLNGIGSAVWDVEISSNEIKRALTFYTSLQM
jgi:3-dehydroquinate synthase